MEWFNINDKLPKNGEIVLVILKHTASAITVDKLNKWSPTILMYQNTWEPDITHWWKVNISDDGQIRGFDRYILSEDNYTQDGKIYYLGNKITHWMPLPELPEKS